MVNNLDWLGELSLIDFLRDTGKHFTVPYMLAKDSVQVRLERGLSFTEFSYMTAPGVRLLAPAPRRMGVELQMGGADQWGNITAGLELIRRTSGSTRRPRSSPPTGSRYKLLLSPSGTKFGKSEAGDSVWLRPDADLAVRVLPVLAEHRRPRRRRRTCAGSREFDRERIEALEAEARDRGRRPAPRSGRWPATSRRARTARRPTARAEADSEALFSGGADHGSGRARVRSTSRPAGSRSAARRSHGGIAALLADAGDRRLTGEARRLIAGGGVTSTARA